jgi:hypothetical protein
MRIRANPSRMKPAKIVENLSVGVLVKSYYTL